ASLRKPGLNDIDAHNIQRLGHQQLFLEVHRHARRLLAVAQGGVEDDDAVLGHFLSPRTCCGVSFRLRGLGYDCNNPAGLPLMVMRNSSPNVSFSMRFKKLALASVMEMRCI